MIHVQSALTSISAYPLDLNGQIFAHYPAMKLGHQQSVDYFAELLTPIALQMSAGMPAEDGGWVLTSPPLWGLPCGANLVCRAIHARLVSALPERLVPHLHLL